MTFQEITLSSKGRINRKTYWVYSLPPGIFFILLDLYESEIEDVFEYYWVLYFIFIYPMIVIQIKRWHDRNKSGLWVLINFVPILGLWALIENGFLKGNESENDYGQPQT